MKLEVPAMARPANSLKSSIFTLFIFGTIYAYHIIYYDFMYIYIFSIIFQIYVQCIHVIYIHTQTYMDMKAVYLFFRLYVYALVFGSILHV